MNVRLLLMNEGGIWVLQCLEYDLCAQGGTPKRSFLAWKRTVTAQILLDAEHGVPPFYDVKPAPTYYFKKFIDGLVIQHEFQAELSAMLSVNGIPSETITIGDVRVG